MKSKVNLAQLACKYGAYCSYIENLKEGHGNTLFYMSHCSKVSDGCQFKGGLVKPEHLTPSKLVEAATAGA